jgi:hypothetical protein
MTELVMEAGSGFDKLYRLKKTALELGTAKQGGFSLPLPHLMSVMKLRASNSRI